MGWQHPYASIRRSLSDVYKNIDFLAKDVYGNRPLRTYKPATLKRIAHYFTPSQSLHGFMGTGGSGSGSEAEKMKNVADKDILVDAAREALWGSFWVHALPVLIALVVVGVTTVRLCAGSFRKSQFTAKYYVYATVVQGLVWLNGLLMLGVVLSWMQEPFQFPRVVVDAFFLDPINGFMVPYLLRFNVTAWIVSNPLNINLLPIALSYTIRQLVAALQVAMTTIKMFKDAHVDVYAQPQPQAQAQAQPYRSYATQPQREAESQEAFSANSILEEYGKEGFLQASLDDSSSVVCQACKQVVARSRFQQHEDFWCPNAANDNLLEVDLDVKAGVELEKTG